MFSLCYLAHFLYLACQIYIYVSYIHEYTGPGLDLAWTWSSDVQVQVQVMVGLNLEGQVQVWKIYPRPGLDQTLDSLGSGANGHVTTPYVQQV